MDAWLLALAASPLVYLGMFAFAFIDGFFPPIPSEAALVGLAALSVSGEQTNLPVLLLVAALGAFGGDLVAYAIGTRIDVSRIPVLRRGRGRRSVLWAENALAHRGPSFILAARFIPIARVAVNVSAGALGYPRARFVALAAAGSVMWSLYSAALGIGAGSWLTGRPMLAVVVGVAGGIVIGVGVDRLLKLIAPDSAVVALEGGVDESPEEEPCGSSMSR